MKSVEAFLDAVRMYLVIGLVVASVNALVFASPSGETAITRTVGIAVDIVGWPRYLVVAGRAVSAAMADTAP